LIDKMFFLFFLAWGSSTHKQSGRKGVWGDYDDDGVEASVCLGMPTPLLVCMDQPFF
jgi:hypothetical protein